MAVYTDGPRFLAAGESCLFIEFADEIDRSANVAVTRLKNHLEKQRNIKLRECVPTYRSLAVYFDPLETSSDKIKEITVRSLGGALESGDDGHTVISIPVCYGGEYGPDIGTVAAHAGISAEEVVARHSGAVYHCYMIGFMPGFAYLGGMDESIAAPRLQNPRSVIPGGSVGIAGKQTGIYPLDGPGGWQLIGRTPLRLFTPEAEQATLVRAGYGVKFIPISEDEYKKIAAQIVAGIYVPEARRHGA